MVSSIDRVSLHEAVLIRGVAAALLAATLSCMCSTPVFAGAPEPDTLDIDANAVRVERGSRSTDAASTDDSSAGVSVPPSEEAASASSRSASAESGAVSKLRGYGPVGPLFARDEEVVGRLQEQVGTTTPVAALIPIVTAGLSVAFAVAAAICALAARSDSGLWGGFRSQKAVVISRGGIQTAATKTGLSPYDRMRGGVNRNGRR